MPESIKSGAHFLEPMECLDVTKLPKGPLWSYELKLDGYRMQAISRAGKVGLRSRRKSSYTLNFPQIPLALQGLPNGTVLDGELAALDLHGRPSMSLLQNHQTTHPPIVYFPFDVLFHLDRNLTRLPLSERRKILRDICPTSDMVILSEVIHMDADGILEFVRENSHEGVVAKRNESYYEAGRRSGAWRKLRSSLADVWRPSGSKPMEASNRCSELSTSIKRGY
ncbi:hypothetical protein [Granulicella sp. dw_53]|uniref:ATP-dependent DNA ligase n=1 Tax=Granulicella sp. dw_53 TaxID=2719792 RepID=UPI001BD59EDD|nr:hypothetical protein [Granulicella sp. dw_53]